MSQQKKKSNLYLALFIILFLGMGAMLFYINKTTNALELERDNLISDLEREKGKFELLQKEKLETDSMLTFEIEQVAMLIDSVKYLTKNIEELNKYKRSYFKLKTEHKNLIAKADSVVLANELLAKEKLLVENELSNEQAKNQTLTNKNNQLSETVALGQILDAQAINVYGLVISSSGKEKVKYKSKKVDKIKTCFTIGKNRIHPSGKKDIFLIISNPEGKVITSALDENSFFVKDQKMLYSKKQTIEYEKEKLEMCMYLDELIEFTPGKYQVQIYTENARIGESVLNFY